MLVFLVIEIFFLSLMFVVGIFECFLFFVGNCVFVVKNRCFFLVLKRGSVLMILNIVWMILLVLGLLLVDEFLIKLGKEWIKLMLGVFRVRDFSVSVIIVLRLLWFVVCKGLVWWYFFGNRGKLLLFRRFFLLVLNIVMIFWRWEVF